MHFAAHRKGTSAFNHFTVNKDYTDIRLWLNAPGWTSKTPCTYHVRITRWLLEYCWDIGELLREFYCHQRNSDAFITNRKLAIVV